MAGGLVRAVKGREVYLLNEGIYKGFYGILRFPKPC
jgi:hypothetical protein